MEENTVEDNGYSQLFDNKHSSKYLVFNRRKELIQVHLNELECREKVHFFL